MATPPATAPNATIYEKKSQHRALVCSKGSERDQTLAGYCWALKHLASAASPQRGQMRGQWVLCKQGLLRLGLRDVQVSKTPGDHALSGCAVDVGKSSQGQVLRRIWIHCIPGYFRTVQLERAQARVEADHLTIDVDTTRHVLTEHPKLASSPRAGLKALRNAQDSKSSDCNCIKMLYAMTMLPSCILNHHL